MMFTAALAATLLLAIAIVAVAATSHSTRTTAAKFDEVVRVGNAQPETAIRANSAPSALDPVAVAAPQGTVRRMDAISKSFSKQ